jgi:hypothetical protein
MGNFELCVVWDNVHLNTFLIRINTGIAVKDLSSSIFTLVGV